MPQRVGNETRKAIEPTQREVLREVMLSAAECGTWLTLDELARLTHYPQASISAQLRHLRKPWHGGFVVEKKRREVDEVSRLATRGRVWEYQVRRAVRWSFAGPRRNFIATRRLSPESGESRSAGQVLFEIVRKSDLTRRGTMSIKPELAFDVCWEVYRGAREVLETKRGVSALNWDQAKKYLWRPDIRPRLNEWVADFALAGKAALGAPERASRMVMFRMYYLGLAPYDNARHFLGLSERSWVNWSEEIRRRCGDELLRRSMFPPRKYFSETGGSDCVRSKSMAEK